MIRLIVFLLVLLGSWPAMAKPTISGPSPDYKTKNSASLVFRIGDLEDSDPIGVSGFCTVRFEQAGGDDVSLYAVTTATMAASSGTLLNAFISSTSPSNPAYTFTASTQWVRAKAVDATAGGSRMVIECSPVFGSSAVGNSLSIGSGGVTLSSVVQDSGKLTILGVGTGADEDLVIDLNTTSNEVLMSSTTGATTLRASFDVIATSFSSSAVASPSMTLDDSVATDSNAESKIDGDATADDNGRIALGVEAGTDGTYELPLIVRSVAGASTAELGRTTDAGANYWSVAEGGVMTPQGTASIRPGGGSTANGSAIWAISDGGSFDTGTEVCTKSGRALTCQSVINFAALGVSPTSVACGTAITNTHTFIAMCY